MSKQTGQVEPSKLMDSQDMPSCQITKNAKEPQADKADHTHKHGSIPRTWDQIHSQNMQHTHHTKAKPKVSSPDIVQSCNYRYQPTYIPLSNSDSPDNNPYYCFFRTSANNNSHSCSIDLRLLQLSIRRSTAIDRRIVLLFGLHAAVDLPLIATSLRGVAVDVLHDILAVCTV